MRADDGATARAAYSLAQDNFNAIHGNAANHYSNSSACAVRAAYQRAEYYGNQIELSTAQQWRDYVRFHHYMTGGR